MNYQEVVETVKNLLSKNPGWEKTYNGYSENIIGKAKIIEDNFKGKQFGKSQLRKYTNITLLKMHTSKSNATVQLRKNGVLIASITSCNDGEFIVKPHKNVINSGWRLRTEKFEWNDPKIGNEFRNFVKSKNSKDFRSSKKNKKEVVESFIENIIIDDLTEYSLGNRIPGMTAVKVGKCGIQFPTAIAASDSIKYAGGSIDILGRIKSKGIGNTLAIIEVKDFKDIPGSKETFEKVMGQAVAYTTFIRELLRNKNTNADKWWNIFGFNNKYGIPEKLILKTIVAMPREDVSNYELEKVFQDRIIKIGNDQIELNCLLYEFDKTENVVKKYCFSEDCLKDKN